MKGTNKLPSPVATAKIQETSRWFDNLWTKNGGNGKEMCLCFKKNKDADVENGVCLYKTTGNTFW